MVRRELKVGDILYIFVSRESKKELKELLESKIIVKTKKSSTSITSGGKSLLIIDNHPHRCLEIGVILTFFNSVT